LQYGRAILFHQPLINGAITQNVLVDKYALHHFKEGEKYDRWEEFLTKEGLKYSLN